MSTVWQGDPVRDAGEDGVRAPVVAPSRADPVVRWSSQVLGGPVGSRAASGSMALAGALLAMGSVLAMGLSVVERQHCRAVGWTSPDFFWHACYSDIPVLFATVPLGGQGRLSLPDALTASGQPPLAAAAMWLLAGLVPGGPHAGRTFFDLSAVVLAVLLAVSVVALSRLSGARRWDAAHLALSPVLVTAGLISYDLLAVALLVAALFWWSRQRPVVAGVLLGLAIGTRPMVAAVLVAVLVLAVRAGRAGTAVRFGVAAAATWFLTRLVLLPGSGAGLAEAWHSWSRTAGPGYGSIWLVPQLLADAHPGDPSWVFAGAGLGPTVATVLSLAAQAAVVVGGAAFALSCRTRPRLGPLALVLLVGVLLSVKSLPPQVGLLVLPLLAVSGLRWRDHLIWAGTELTYFLAVWLYIAASSNPNRGLPADFYLVILLARAGGLVWVAVQAARMCRDPRRDPVRFGSGLDDPAGGVLDGAPDALLVRLG